MNGSWENLYLYHQEMVGSFVWWSCRLGKDAFERRGIPGPDGFWAWSYQCSWVGRVADATGPGPMVPTLSFTKVVLNQFLF